VFLAIDAAARSAGFSTRGAVVEVKGLCAECAGQERGERLEPAHGRP
jgi:Fe2+ or Zn2+ uptake regulation protein